MNNAVRTSHAQSADSTASTDFTVLNAPESPAQGSLVEPKSEFIGNACHVATLDEALAFVQTIRERHPKARHVAYAGVCGASERLSERMSDDGEPSGTAGKPILDVLRAKRLTDCVVSVTRYFGGILLGSGGLIRAYATAASLAVEAADRAALMPSRHYRVALEYRHLGAFEHLLESVQGTRVDASYAQGVVCEVLVPCEQCDRFESQLRNAFSGTVRPQALDIVNQIVPQAVPLK
jgi:uncharacterized YigZ family protein